MNDATVSACAVVTGAGRGIGRAVALALGRRGVSVALLARTREELEEVALTFREANGPSVEAKVVTCDVGDVASVAAAAREVEALFGPPRIVINNAGIVRRASTHEMTTGEWDAVIRVNLTGAFLVSRAFLPSMLARRCGRIVNVASISATLGTARQAAYNASKWGVVGFTKSLAEELRGTGLQAMAVLPGAVDTTMLVGSGFTPQMTPEDVARTLLFAALDAPDAMNGAALEIFGP